MFFDLKKKIQSEKIVPFSGNTFKIKVMLDRTDFLILLAIANISNLKWVGFDLHSFALHSFLLHFNSSLKVWKLFKTQNALHIKP